MSELQEVRPSIPLFLTRYDFIEELRKWAENSTSSEERRWWVCGSTTDPKHVTCRLTWWIEAGRMCLEQIHSSAEEATYAALLKFGNQWRQP